MPELSPPHPTAPAPVAGDGRAPIGDAVATATLFEVLVRHRRLILGLPLLCGLLTAVVVARRPREFRSTATFSVQGRSNGPSGGLASVASQFGLSVGGQGGEGSPAFLLSVLQSRRLLSQVVKEPHDVGTGAPVPLTVAYARLDAAEEPALSADAAVSRLSRDLNASFDRETGISQVDVTAPTPQLAASITEHLLAALDRFNIESRQSRASAERRFVSGRLDEMRLQLATAESRYQRFLSANRDFSGSPELVLAQDRLAREVAMRQQLVTSLEQSLEQAKIEEVRDTPVITVVETPSATPRPVSRGLAMKTMLAMILGGLGAVLLLIARFLLQSWQAAPATPEAQALRRELAEARRDLLRPWRLLLPTRRRDA